MSTAAGHLTRPGRSEPGVQGRTDLAGERSIAPGWRECAQIKNRREIGLRGVYRPQALHRAAQQGRDSWPVAADSAVAMHNHADGHPALPIERTEAVVRLNDPYHVAKAQAAEAI